MQIRKETKLRIIKLILTLSILLVASYIFLSYPVIIMPDSTEYYGYLKIFNGQESFSNWDIVRGPTFPTILYVITLLFGNTEKGILLGCFIFYLLLNICCIIILKKIKFKNRKIKIIAYGIVLILITFNPILIGYMHCLLTEFATIPMLVIFTLLSAKWIHTEKKSEKNIISLLLILSCIFMWFLKQPYVFIAIGPVLIASIISVSKNKNYKNIMYRICVTLFCVAGILIANNIWTSILKINNVNINNGRDTGSFIKTAIINGNSAYVMDYHKEHYSIEYVDNDYLISDKDKEQIRSIINNESEYRSFIIINLYKDFSSREDNNIEEKLILYSSNDEYTTSDAIKMFFKMFFKHPVKTLKAYCMNYGTIANIVSSMRYEDANMFYPSVIGNHYYENETIGYCIYNSEENIKWVNETDNSYKNVENLKTENHSPKIINNIANKTFEEFNGIYSLLIISLPILLVALIKRIINEKKEDIKIINEIGILLIGSSLIHILFHTATNAIIDRYGFVVFPSVVIGVIILLFNYKIEKKEERNMEKYIGKSNKTLTIIPAYNESQNIQKVIKELKTDFNETDILVINDSSTDNTKEIVESNNINCITTVFNLNYAYAVQTGIKYALKYNYDYCLMFDGDGQHIAKEAKKLLEKIKETNCDIVIGSRYLENGNYNAPKLRKIGTSFFTCLIKISCNKKISDPLSGFQIINRRIIEKYSKMGEYPEFPDANLIIEMLIEGYTIEEVSVKMRNRESGESMHGGIIKPIKYMIVMLYTILLLILNKLFGRRK